MAEDSTVKAPSKRRPLKVIGRSLLVVLLFVVMAVGSLYIPGVSNRVVQWLAPSIEDSAGLRISASNISLHFPLRLRVDELLILDTKASADTMLFARQADLSVSPLALMSSRLSADDARIINGLYRMGGRDSMYINARMDSVLLAVRSDFTFADIEVVSPQITGARIDLIMGSVQSEKDSVSSSEMKLRLSDVRLQNVLYSMYMAAGNDTVYARIRHGSLTDGSILAADTVRIAASHIDLDVDSALYGKRGAMPEPGLDFCNMLVRDAAVSIDSFQMNGTALSLPITSMSVSDLAGMNVVANGVYSMTDEALHARNFDVSINGRSRVKVDAMMGLDTVAPVPVNLDVTAQLSTADLASAFPSASPMLAPLPDKELLNVRAVLSGTMAQLGIETLSADMPSVFSVSVSGSVGGFDNLENLSVKVDLLGSLQNSRPFASMMPQNVNLPPLTLSGKVRAQGMDYAADLKATAASGTIALNGELIGKAPHYSLSLKTDSLPIAAFMPDLGIGAITASVEAAGAGFNPRDNTTELNASVGIDMLEFYDCILRDMSMSAQLNNGDFEARMKSSAPAANFDVDLFGSINSEVVNWQLVGDVNRVDLLALGLSDSIMNASMQLESKGYASMTLDSLEGNFGVQNLALAMGSESYRIDSLQLNAKADNATHLLLAGRDFHVAFNSESAPAEVVGSFAQAANLASSMVASRFLESDSLVNELPRFSLDFNALANSPVQQFLRSSDMNFNSVILRVSKDSLLTADAQVLRLSNWDRTSRLDTITAALTSRANRLLLDVNINNRPGTLDEFASVGFRGILYGNNSKLFLRQKNLKGDTGYRLGFLATLTDSVLGVQLTPFDPIVAYRNWQINEDNYVAFNPSTFHLYANLDARGGGSRIRLLTSESDSLGSENEVKLKVDNIRLQDWLKINPFAPPIAGNASADMVVSYSDKNVTGDGTLSLDSLTYGRRKVGDFNLALGLATDYGGAIYANLGLDVNGRRALYALGEVNDTTGSSPLNMYLRVKEFPLDIANPFLPSSTAQLSGTLNGAMNVSGRLDAVKLNGNLGFRQAKVNVGMLGSTFSLDSVDIPVESNLVTFNDYAIYGSNSNPLRVTGIVDLRRFEIPRVDLNFDAKNMQVVNSKKGRGVDLYGRGFVDLDASVKGSLSFLNVNANLAVLPETNLTYQVSDAAAVAGLQPEESVVRFVNFADTAHAVVVDSVAPTSMKMMLSALLDIRQGAQFTVNLSADGTNRAQIKGQGILDYTMSPVQPDGRLTGRFSIDEGSFRYSLPVISEKLFNFQRGSYVAFNGDILNPTLSVTATDQVRANVTRAGENSRLVNFDVILNASGTPQRLDVAFDLSTSDDLTVANELQSMSANQRANQAMNLLLYGVYSGSGSSSGLNLSGNALYGFLSSQLNTWAAKSIKGVDLSFGVDKLDTNLNGAQSSAMQYSYKVSKSLFNDRFKIVVGGNYSTDADAEENFAQNLISDISFEYMLNRSGSMYVRLFRKTGFESILEGEVTQTGAGFVVRRKINRLADIFNFTKAVKQ